MTLNDKILALIRTYVPYAIGAAFAWAAMTGTGTDEGLQPALIALAVALAQNAYYLLARLLEQKVPIAGVLLGIPRQPTYTSVTPLWTSVVRTGIPTLVGALVTSLVASFVPLDADTQVAVIAAGVALIEAAYYAAAKATIARWPAASRLLGTKAELDAYSAA